MPYKACTDQLTVYTNICSRLPTLNSETTTHCAGNWYVTKAGEKLALSPSSGDPVHFTCGHCFALSCSSCSQQNGQRGANADCPLRASFLSACCKVSYESAPIIRDVITERCVHLKDVVTWRLKSKPCNVCLKSFELNILDDPAPTFQHEFAVREPFFR